MKTNKIMLVIIMVALINLSSCAPENDIKTPEFNPLVLSEDFSSNTIDDSVLNVASWTNFAQAGTVKWKQGVFYSDKYAKFTGFQSNEPSNIGWLISPAINMDVYDNEKIVFQIAQAYVSSRANSVEFLVSTNFNGTNVSAATWETKAFTLPSLSYNTNFKFFDSGIIDLSGYTGKIHIAFKVKGSGAYNSLDGTYEIDNVRIFNQKK